MELGIASFAAITVIAYLVGYFCKTADNIPDKWIPCICGIAGCILGIVAYYIKVPDFPANDVLNAAAVGVVSGFSATAINQIYKQLTKDKNATVAAEEISEEVSEESEAVEADAAEEQSSEASE